MTTLCKRWRMRLADRQGLTLLEVLTVLVIMAILAAVMVSRTSLSADVGVIAEAEALKSQLRFAQGRAMNSAQVWGVECSGNAYRLFRVDGGSRTYVTMPGTGGASVNLGGEGYSVSGFEVGFDEWGRPFDMSSGMTLLTSNKSITVSRGSESETLTITKHTGFIA